MYRTLLLSIIISFQNHLFSQDTKLSLVFEPTDVINWNIPSFSLGFNVDFKSISVEHTSGFKLPVYGNLGTANNGVFYKGRLGVKVPKIKENQLRFGGFFISYRYNHYDIEEVSVFKSNKQYLLNNASITSTVFKLHIIHGRRYEISDSFYSDILVGIGFSLRDVRYTAENIQEDFSSYNEPYLKGSALFDRSISERAYLSPMINVRLGYRILQKSKKS